MFNLEGWAKLAFLQLIKELNHVFKIILFKRWMLLWLGNIGNESGWDIFMVMDSWYVNHLVVMKIRKVRDSCFGAWCVV